MLLVLLEPAAFSAEPNTNGPGLLSCMELLVTGAGDPNPANGAGVGGAWLLLLF